MNRDCLTNCTAAKVRDTYAIDDNLLLMVATDRISAFDVVLPTGIPQKGKVLNRISSFWFDKTAHLIPNHLVALADADNAGSYLSANSDLPAFHRNWPARP